jgi:hypothetical protein
MQEAGWWTARGLIPVAYRAGVEEVPVILPKRRPPEASLQDVPGPLDAEMAGEPGNMPPLEHIQYNTFSLTRRLSHIWL